MKNETYNDMSELLPHKPPMVFIDSLLEYDLDKKTVTSSFTVTEKSVFFDSSILGVPSTTAMEYMAQCIGVLSGVIDKATERETALGFLLGSRSLSLHADVFKNECTYTVTASENFFESELGNYSCDIKDADGNILAEAEINVYRPQDPSKAAEIIGAGR